MAKKSLVYVCTECGFETPKWMGKCPSCASWNTLDEFNEVAHSAEKKVKNRNVKTTKLGEIQPLPRMESGVSEFDRVLGGGAVKGEVVVIGGTPGVGKSTLLLSVADGFAKKDLRVLYFSAEESLEQVFRRANRVLSKANITSNNLSFVNSIDADDAHSIVSSGDYDVVIIDSVQAISAPDISSVAGSVAQVRECAYRITHAAKDSGTVVVLVGHITKGGMLAGPMVLSHVVDAVFMLENENLGDLRILRSIKNRFGSIDEAGVFQMLESGMESVVDISSILMDSKSTFGTPGIAKGVLLEGIRPMLIDIQALVVKSGYSMPKRIANGFGMNRLQMLIAVLSKHLKLKLNEYDIFVNIAGGFRSSDPSLDLPICAAILSSLKNKSLAEGLVLIGEVGLTGDVHKVIKQELREKECKRLGYGNPIPSLKSVQSERVLLRDIFSNSSVF